MFEEFSGKRVLFITTKNLDYLRNTQEIRLLREKAQEVRVIGSNKSSYPLRLLQVWVSLLFCGMKRYDAAFVGFAPQLIVPFFGWKWRHKPLYIDFFISLYDTFCFDRQIASPKSSIGKLLRRLDEKTLRRADVIICDTKAHGAFFADTLKAAPEKLQVLYLEADTEIYYPRQEQRPPEAEGKFVVLYFGSVLPLQGVDVVLDAFARFASHPAYCCYMIGPVDRNGKLPEGPSLHYIDWLPQEELARYIGFSDLCLAGHFHPDIGKAKCTIPGKAYIYRAMEKPMILGDNPANRELFDEAQEGIWFTAMGSGETLAAKIAEISGLQITGDYVKNNLII